jgi:hypothetical protein
MKGQHPLTMEALCLLLPREATQAKIACFCSATMSFRDDVIDFEGEPVAFLWNLTVFGAIAGPLPYQFLERAFHAYSIRPRLLLLICVTGRLERPASLGLHDV